MAPNRRQVSISPREFDALVRIVYPEAGIRELFFDKASKRYLPAEDDQGFPLRKTWELLGRPKKRDVERAIQREVLTHLSEQAFGAPQSVRGRATHYLNPDVPGTEPAKQSWAQDWPTWDQVGKRPRAHFFGVGKGEAPPPDYDVVLEPGVREMLGSVYQTNTLPRVHLGPSGNVERTQNPMTMAPARMPAPGYSRIR